MARDVLGTEAAEGVLLVFDSPEINQPRDEGGVALMMERLANMVVSGAPLVPLDVSRYFCIDFAATSRTSRHRAKRAGEATRPTGQRAGAALATVVAELGAVRYRMGK